MVIASFIVENSCIALLAITLLIVLIIGVGIGRRLERR
jgi:hypothetical protein